MAELKDGKDKPPTELGMPFAMLLRSLLSARHPRVAAQSEQLIFGKGERLIPLPLPSITPMVGAEEST
jgi:hypothetical protein